MLKESCLSQTISTESKRFPTLQESRFELSSDYTCEVTNDMQYLRQYFFIREYAYRTDLGLKNFSGEEDKTDQYSHFIIVRIGHFVIAGSRLTVVPIGIERSLPLEEDGFVLREMYPLLNKVNYCELGRTAILPQYRQGKFLEDMFRVAAQVAIAQDCKFLVGASPTAVARRFRSIYNQMGYPTQIHLDIHPPVKPIHEHLKLKFLITTLCPEERWNLKLSHEFCQAA